MRVRPGSDVLRAAFLAGVAFGDDGGSKAGTEVFRKRIELRIAVNLDGLLGGIADHVTVVAPGEMIFQFRFRAIINRAIQVVRQLTQELSTLHWVASPV